MKKLLFILLALACLAWSDNYGVNGYGCTSGYSCSSEEDGAEEAEMSGKAAPSPSSAALGSFLGNLVPAAKQDAATSQENPVPDNPVNSFKKYDYRLSFYLGYMMWDNEYISKPLGVDFDMAFTLRSGGDHFFVEYGLSVALMGIDYHFERAGASFTYDYNYFTGGYSYSEYWDTYESEEGWLQIAMDAQLYLGLEIWKIILRWGAYGGYVIGPETAGDIVNPNPYERDNLTDSAYKYHYGSAGMFAFRLAEGFELNMQTKIDLSRFSEEYPGFFSVGIGMGFLF